MLDQPQCVEQKKERLMFIKHSHALLAALALITGPAFAQDTPAPDKPRSKPTPENPEQPADPSPPTKKDPQAPPPPDDNTPTPPTT